MHRTLNVFFGRGISLFMVEYINVDGVIGCCVLQLVNKMRSNLINVNPGEGYNVFNDVMG